MRSDFSLKIPAITQLSCIQIHPVFCLCFGVVVPAQCYNERHGRTPFAPFSQNSQHPQYLSSRTGTQSLTRLDPSASTATALPLASEPPSNKNSRMALYAPSSISAEPPSTMSKTEPLWNSKPDASCGVLDALDVIYSVCTSSFSRASVPPANFQDRRNQTAHSTLDGIPFGL